MGPGAPEWPALELAGPLPHLGDRDLLVLSLPSHHLHQAPSNTHMPRVWHTAPQLPSLSFAGVKKALPVLNLGLQGLLYSAFALAASSSLASFLFRELILIHQGHICSLVEVGK